MKILVLAVAAVALQGCIQLVRFADGPAFYNPARSERDHESPYKCTKLAADWFCAPARLYEFGDARSCDPVGEAWLTLFWPVSLIDIPCEAVIDTAMLVPDILLQR